MFGLSSYGEFVQGSALKTWNCVAHFANLLWYKFVHLRDPIMPRSRRRHHSRSRSRSRSHSHDRDREPKRRKIESYDSPHHRRSVSSEPEAIKTIEDRLDSTESVNDTNDDSKKDSTSSNEESESNDTDMEDSVIKEDTPKKPKDKTEDLKITPNRVLSPKQVQKRLESEKKRQEKQREREESKRKRLELKEEKERQKMEEKRKIEEEKKRSNEEKMRLKQEREEQRLKEKLAKQEEKDKKKREKDQKDELKKKEIEEKNKEKQKLEEQKQKTAAAFASFFVAKKTVDNSDDKKAEETAKFMPFEVKSDMRLAPVLRRSFASNDVRVSFDEALQKQANNIKLYLEELRQGKEIGKSAKTWREEETDQDDDVVVVEEKVGESIVEQNPKLEKMRAKFFKFHENQRPPYFGTWKKKSRTVRARKPFARDDIFNYEVDSDDEWEEEGEGESLKGTDDEDEKENESDDYEVDNEVFVPHDYLSEDERDDEENERLSPSAHKAKLKLCKREFDEEMKSQTQKLKPTMIGCVWYDKTKTNVDEALDRYLQQFAIICKGRIHIKKRCDIVPVSARKSAKLLDKEHVPLFLKFIHGSVDKKKNIVREFVEHLKSNGVQLEASQYGLVRQLKSFAQWKKCPDEGTMHNKMCWYVAEGVRKEYNVNLTVPENQAKVNRRKTK